MGNNESEELLLSSLIYCGFYNDQQIRLTLEKKRFGMGNVDNPDILRALLTAPTESVGFALDALKRVVKRYKVVWGKWNIPAIIELFNESITLAQNELNALDK